MANPMPVLMVMACLCTPAFSGQPADSYITPLPEAVRLTQVWGYVYRRLVINLIYVIQLAKYHPKLDTVYTGSLLVVGPLYSRLARQIMRAIGV